MRHIYKELPKHPTKRYRKRDTSKVDTIVLHHSASNPNKPMGGWAVYVHNTAKYHIGTLGWPAIGYHYMIDPDGEVYKTNPVKLRTYHAKGGNSTGIGVCLIGDFTATSPPDVQLRALRELAADIRRAMPSVKYVIGHKQVKGSRTACPGDAFPMAALKAMEA